VVPNNNLELFSDLLTALTHNAIEETNNAIIARSEEELSDVEFGVLEFAKAANIECKTSIKKKKNEDWILKYQESVKSIEVGKFFVRPSWDKPKDNTIDIIIDPALSFGSGHHETTNACLQAISEYVKKEDNVIDVGCGSGILGIAASKLGAKVDICDTDEVCIKDSEVNFSLNNTQYNSAWIGSALKANKTYDVVIANIVADVLIMIASDLKKCLEVSGMLIISGILNKHLNRVLKKFDDLETIETINKDEWTTVVLRKRGV
jgi:ribosomal protein L11 methyltransferase